MRIVFAGSPDAAVPSLEAVMRSRHEVVAVITREDSRQGRRGIMTPTPVAATAQQHGLEVIRANRLSDSTTARVAELAPDLGVIVAYGGLVKEPLLSLPRLGWINVHFSALPRWRGAAPVQRAIIAGDETTGVTVFQLVPELDAGDVLGAVTEPIGRHETAGNLLSRLATIGSDLLVDTIEALSEGSASRQPQQGEVTVAPKLSIDDGRLDFARSAAEVYNRIRGVTPEPGAFTSVDGVRLKILEAAPARGIAALDPGVLDLRGRAVVVGTADEPIELIRVQPAGRTAMDASAWWRGRPADAARVAE